MFVTQHNPWFVRAHAPSRHVLNHIFRPAADGVATEEAQAWVPRVDIREESGRFVILADLPGVDLADIEIQMEKGALSLKGERKVPEVGEGVTSTRSERLQGRFDRRFALPDSVDAEGISAAGRNGVLEISIPKKPETTPRRIVING
ncbi:MAG: Hsp20/alpha crystallin family protein [Dokdonella sp.]